MPMDTATTSFAGKRGLQREVSETAYELACEQNAFFVARPFGYFHFANMVWTVMEPCCHNIKQRRDLAGICAWIADWGPKPSNPRRVPSKPDERY